jgi:Tfp pilus assembly major pilin PilA
MRYTSLLVLACLAGLPSTLVLGADSTGATAGTTTATAAIPEANKSLLEKCISLAGQVSSGAHLAQDTAQTAANLPFAGASVKKSLETAKAKSADADNLTGELKGLLDGKPASNEGMLSQVSKGTLNLGDRFKSIPGAETLQKVLATPGVTTSLMQMLPVDKVPGYASVQQMLSAVGK